MTRHFLWNEHAELLTKPLATVLMALRREDGDNDLLMDSVTLSELTEEADRMLAIDGVVAQYNQIERVAGQMEAVMRRAAGTVKPVTKQISDPFTQHGALQVVVLFELSDGQTISIYFHNPDTTPKKIASTDELVSWKWLLNKKDVTILVAPEQGKELNAREVARRVMKAAEKNSAAFVRNNAKRAERLQAIEAMKTEIIALETECKDLERQIEEARLLNEEPALVVEPEPTGELPTADEPATVEITGKELGEFPDTPEGLKALRKAAEGYLKSLRGAWVECPALNADVEIRAIGIKKFISFSADPRKLKLGAEIKRLIGSASKIGEGESYAPDVEKNVKAYHYLRAVASLEGKPVAARIVVREDMEGAYHYDMTVHGINESLVVAQEKSPADAGLDSATASNVGGVTEKSASPSRLASCQLDSSLDPNQEYFNLFIEGEEPEVVTGVDEETAEDNPYWSVMTLTERARVLATIGLITKTGRPSVRAKALAALSWADLPADTRAKLSQHPAISNEPAPEPIPEPESTDETDIDPEAIARVDAAYRFESATDEFKAWVAESVDSRRGPFSTARAMEERAKAHGATIEWGLFGGAWLDAVYVEDDDEGDVALDASEHWKKQPRDKKSGRWVLRRMKRMKQAAKKAGETVANAARAASDYVTQALKGGDKGDGKSAAGKLAQGADAALEGGAKINPGLAAIHELVGGVKTVARAFDSAVDLDAARPVGITDGGKGYVGKIRKDGEIVGRADIDDEGAAMVFVGASGVNTVKDSRGRDGFISAEIAPDMIDWLFAMLNDHLIPDGAENTVKTAKGTKVETGFAVVEADTLIVSHDNQGNPNPDYPAELQPRDRGRETSIAWIRKTANQLDPDSLGKTRRADTGAPIVGPDRVVESGNGRAMAIQEAYRTGKADEYREWLIEEAESFGLNPARIRAMKHPVLVRVRTSDIDRRTFAIEANQDDKLAMTATEKARSDADRLDEALLSKLADDGDLLSAANRDFIRGFLASLGDAEAAQYITTDGQPTAALIARVQAAVFAKAYSDDRLLELTADASKPEIANILNALNAAALEFIRAQAAAKGATDALTSEIATSVETSLNAQAVQAIIDATNLVRKARAEGQSVEEVVNQRGLFDDIPPATAAMALFIHKNNRSAKRMATAFRAMARHVRQEAERGQTVDLFGDLKPATLEDIIGAANRELEREYGEGQFAIETLDLFGLAKGAEPAPSPIERLKDMLLRGDIGAAVDFLGTLKEKDLQEVLLKNGFTISFGTATDILKSVQQDLIRAAKLKTDGFGLHALDEPPSADLGLATEPEPLARPFDVDDRLTWEANGMTSAVIFRGYEGDKGMIYDPKSGMQMAVPLEQLRREDQSPADPQKDADRALFQSVIDGAVPDMLSPDLGREMIAAYERNQADAELIALAEQAMDIYEQAMLDAEIPQ